MPNDAKYYLLSPAVDTSQTGRAFPAVESYADYDFSARDSVHRLKSGEFPDFLPDIRFKLARGANLCDMMGQATINAHGFLISERLKIFFENFKIIPHKYFPATIENKGTFSQYYWMHLVWKEAGSHIDFINSDFFARRFSKNLGQVEIRNESDILEKRSQFDIATQIDFNKIVLKNVNEDMFVLNYFIDVYISENLKLALQKEKLTGIQMSLTGKLQVFL